MIDRVMVVVAAGSSVRFGDDKMLLTVAGKPMVAHTVAAVIDHVDRCILVCRPDQMPVLTDLGIGADLVAGGASRTASERAGLAAIGEPAGLVGIHDGARPMVSADLIETLFETAARVGGAIPVLEASVPIVDRAEMAPVEDAFVAQTPQVFRGEPLMAAYAAAAVAGYEAQDTAAIARRFAEIDIEAVPGDPGNLKVTIPGDVDLVRTALEPSRTEPR
ncbi:MAG TPA: 2-C-methyl-D-erythritol 4-phosphate cytidylyltransferase [Acidimicrobiia bacterium]|jgi:2-C-methyl-D-erythritol 4-phosphate cytidylyltransferase|nr:2-C-methyl-D-erythritol 4-phosphate cytidylyltransferase [Acidimicrobiia bacterium]